MGVGVEGGGGGGEREVLNPKFFVPSSMRTGQYTKLHYLRITIVLAQNIQNQK